MTSARGRLTKDGIRIYEPGDFAGMKEAGRVAATILDDILYVDLAISWVK